MSTLKKWLLILLVSMAFLATSLGGIEDILGIRLTVTKEHSWNDGIFLILTAIFVAIVLK